MINQQIIKTNNLKRVYKLIAGSPTISRIQIANATKLSKATVSALVDELIQEGYVKDTGTLVGANTALGRKPNLLELNSTKNVVAVISWHRNRLEAALVDIAGEIVYKELKAKTAAEDYGQLTISLLRGSLAEQAEEKRILGVCIVTPAMVDDEKRQVVSTVLPLEGGVYDIEGLCAQLPEYPVAVFNDTACYAYAEWRLHTKEKNFAFVNLSRGVGAALLTNGQALRGANGMATQFGHFSIDRNGPVCACGNRGCLESRVGEQALEERAMELGCLSVFAQKEKVGFAELASLVDEQNAKAMRLMQCLAGDMAYALSNVISLCHPQLIVLGGEGKKLGPAYLQCLQNELAQMGFPQFVADVTVRFAKVGPEAKFHGAALYFMNQHFSFGRDMKGELFLT